MAYFHRLDDKNVGDLFCAPYLYFDDFPGPIYDIFDKTAELSHEKLVIVGGGGLGRNFFSKPLRRLAASDRPYKLVAWGVGADAVINKTGAALNPDGDYDLYSNFFEGFDEVGSRSFSTPQRYRWVPCVSAMHRLLDRYRDKRPTKGIGYYQHKHSRFIPKGQRSDTETNNGGDLESKLAFIADHEYLVSNTYHGVYWATLLNRKVLCLPFKSGLFSFKHKPLYITDLNPTDDQLHDAISYPDSLEECRQANILFKNDLLEEYIGV